MGQNVAAFLGAFLLGLTAAGADGVLPSGEQRRIEKPLALYIIKHAELARQKAVDLGTLPVVKASKKGARLVQSIAGDIRTDILEPIYNRFPELRGQDVRRLAVAPVKSFGPIDKATAERIDRSVERLNADRQALNAALNTTDRTPEDVQIMMDLLAEAGFITAPVDRQFPSFFEARMTRLKPAVDPRTDKSDAAMRRRAVPIRDIKLTSVARVTISDFARELERHGKYVLAISWDLGGASKGPDDTHWKKTGAGLSIGGYERSQVPPDIVAMLDGIPIVFFDDQPPRIRGKTIDFKNGGFFLED